MNLSKNGVTIQIDDAAVVDMVLRNLVGQAPTGELASITVPRIGAPLLEGTFMGLVRSDNGARDGLLIDLGEAPSRMNFAAAQKWAEEKGGRLPTRREQALMFANRGDGQYKPEWYWSGAQYEGGGGYAWFQYFVVGTQDNAHKDYECNGRAVRLVDPSVIR